MQYGFSARQYEFDGEKVWVVESTELKGCIGQGQTVGEALAELESNEQTWLEIARKRGIEIPAPSTEYGQTEYSGKLTLRLGKRVHGETVKCAKEEGLSVNQYITDAVVTYNTKHDIYSAAYVSENRKR